MATRRRRISAKPTRSIVRHQTYMNVSETWKNGEGRRNLVVIRNGTGTKQENRLGPRGQILNTQTRRLTPSERSKILRGEFVPGLWKNLS